MEDHKVFEKGDNKTIKVKSRSANVPLCLRLKIEGKSETSGRGGKAKNDPKKSDIIYLLQSVWIPLAIAPLMSNT